jgi:hypothetical protein
MHTGHTLSAIFAIVNLCIVNIEVEVYTSVGFVGCSSPYEVVHSGGGDCTVAGGTVVGSPLIVQDVPEHQWRAIGGSRRLEVGCVEDHTTFEGTCKIKSIN